MLSSYQPYSLPVKVLAGSLLITVMLCFASVAVSAPALSPPQDSRGYVGVPYDENATTGAVARLSFSASLEVPVLGRSNYADAYGSFVRYPLVGFTAGFSTLVNPHHEFRYSVGFKRAFPITWIDKIIEYPQLMTFMSYNSVGLEGSYYYRPVRWFGIGPTAKTYVVLDRKPQEIGLLTGTRIMQETEDLSNAIPIVSDIGGQVRYYTRGKHSLYASFLLSNYYKGSDSWFYSHVYSIGVIVDL